MKVLIFGMTSSIMCLPSFVQLRRRLTVQRGRLSETDDMLTDMVAGVDCEEAVSRQTRQALCQYLKNKSLVRYPGF